MHEKMFQQQVIARIERMLPGCYILKNDSTYMQGVPDLIVLYGPKWAMLEIKRSAKDATPSKLRPNQAHHTSRLSSMGFAEFIYPDNAEEILHALQRALRP